MSQTTDSGSGAVVGQVLLFKLGDEAYCVSIDHVTEIVDMGNVTAVPNSPPAVKGVMDLRGNTTTIVDPNKLLNLDEENEEHRIIVFDPELFDEEQSVGWVVDEVHEVTRFTDDELDDSPVEDEYIEGIVKRDSGFVVWINPRQLQPS